MAEVTKQKHRRVRTPTLLQMEATECGAAALGIVLSYYGTYVPLSTLREECGVSRDGSKASNVLKAGRKYGLECRGFRKEPKDLRAMPMPCIIHWNFNHFLVLEGFEKGKVFLNDPAMGPVTVTEAEFEHAFTGVVLTLTPTPEFKPAGKRKSVLPALFGRLAGSHSAVLFLVLAGVGLVVPSLVGPVFSMVFIDEVLVAGKSYWLPALLLGMALSAVIRAALTTLQRTYLVKLLMKLGVSASTGFMWHALRLPLGFYYSRMPGDLAARLQVNDTVASTLSSRLSGAFLDLLLAVFYLAFLAYLDPTLTLVGIGTVVGHIALLRVTDRVRSDLSRRVGQDAGKLAGVAASGLQMIETVKASGSETEFFARWAGHQAKLVVTQQRAARREALLLTLGTALSHVNALLVLSVGALHVMQGRMSVGALVAFQGLMAAFLLPVDRLAQAGGTLQQLRGDLERLDDVLEHPRDKTVPATAATEPESAPPRRLIGELTLRGVTFGYLPFAPPLVENLDLKISPGQRVSLVGGSGSGKSTVARLVCGLYRPWSGDILFDGEPRETLPRSALVASVAMVDQDIALFEGTVRENLTLWDDTIPETDVVQAAKDACIHEDITKLPGGYDARVTEGGFNFSGGQRQRIEIARALVRQPALIVLDEATSALDPETERQVDENLRRRGCSCLIVAHRLSTIRDSDEIIVLERGRAVERGAHDELMERGQAYRALIAMG